MINLFDIHYNKRFPFIHISKSNLFAILFISITLGVLGFIMESVLQYNYSQAIIDRGFLYGPFIPIYFVFSFFSLLFIKVPTINSKNFVKLFFVFSILITILEFVVGNVIELLTGATLWNYDHLIFSYGYVSLLTSIAWGVLSTLFYMFLVPILYKVTLHIPSYLSIFITFSFSFVLTIDTTLSIYDIIKNSYYRQKYFFVANEILTKSLLLSLLYYYLLIILFYYLKDKTNKTLLSISSFILAIVPLINIILYISFYL